jgi:hypothetical protein
MTICSFEWPVSLQKLDVDFRNVKTYGYVGQAGCDQHLAWPNLIVEHSMPKAKLVRTVIPTIVRAPAIGERSRQMSSSPTKPAVNPDARLIRLAERIRLNAETAFGPDTPNEAQKNLTREYLRLKRTLGALSATNAEGLFAKATAGMLAFNLGPDEQPDPDHDFYVAWSACRDVLRLIGVAG